MAPPSDSGTRRAIVGWSLYDLANTIFYLLVVTLHFPDVMKLASGRESTVALVIGPAMLASALLAPAFGSAIDLRGRARLATVALTAACVVATAFLGAGLGVFGLSLLFGGALLAYELATVSYNTLLPAVAGESIRGRVSGLGVALGYAGNLIALASIDLLGIREPAAVFAFAAAAFALFALPLAALVPEIGPTRAGPCGARELAAATRKTLRTLARSIREPGLGRLLIGLFLACDAVNTVLFQFGRYAASPAGLGLDRDARLRFLFEVNVAAIAGGLLLGWLSDRVSSRRVTLLSIALLSCGLIGAEWIASPLPRAIAMSVLSGSGVAGIWTASRQWVLEMVPRERAGEVFGLYGFVLRASAASLLPFTWLVDARGDYRASVGLLLALLAAAFVVLARVPARRS